jgi:cell wall-active antibiotic response 4TMS protein YvqF
MYLLGKGDVAMTKNVLADKLSEPLNGARTAKFYVHAGDGNLTIDRLTSGEPVLANGTLQYLENQGLPSRTLIMSNSEATLTLKGGHAGQPWFRFPWAACNGATHWQIYLNPIVSYDLTAHSDGGNIKLNLAGVYITRLAVDTGGGNIDVALPDNAANLNITAKTGAGNVTVDIGWGTLGSNIVDAASGAGNVEVHIPSGVAARIHASTGLGKAIVDPRFSAIDKNTYQSSDFEGAANRVELTVNSGAGNVVVNTK